MSISDRSPADDMRSGGPKRLADGDVVAGKFIVERTIGRGGMGQVVCARHRELGTRVAIKVLHASEALDAESVARFKREALSMAKLRSEHTVRVYDVGETDTGMPFMIMEYLEGQDLGSLLREKGPLVLGDALAWMIQACEALVEAHDVGIVHRDLKPQNLFLSRRASGEQQIRVLDFGLAKPFDGPLMLSPKLTRPGDVVGTTHYMAPEQVRGCESDARTDIWGAGVCLFRLLTRAHAFPGESPVVICAAVLTEPAPKLRALRPQTPDAVEAIVDRCLQKDPAHRYASMRDLIAALRSAPRSEVEDVTKTVPLPMLPPEDFSATDPDLQSPEDFDTTVPDLPSFGHDVDVTVRLPKLPQPSPAMAAPSPTPSPTPFPPAAQPQAFTRTERLPTIPEPIRRAQKAPPPPRSVSRAKRRGPPPPPSMFRSKRVIGLVLVVVWLAVVGMALTVIFSRQDPPSAIRKETPLATGTKAKAPAITAITSTTTSSSVAEPNGEATKSATTRPPAKAATKDPSPWASSRGGSAVPSASSDDDVLNKRR